MESETHLAGDHPSTQRDRAVGEERPVVVSVVEERLDVQRRVVETGGALRLRKRVHEEVVGVEDISTTEIAEVERVAVGRPVDVAPAVRYEGDVMIVPVLAERVVTRTELVLVEELRVTRRREQQRSEPREVTLRREEVVVERLDPASGEWRPHGPDAAAAPGAVPAAPGA